jgi:hypothetical protein
MAAIPSAGGFLDVQWGLVGRLMCPSEQELPTVAVT